MNAIVADLKPQGLRASHVFRMDLNARELETCFGIEPPIKTHYLFDQSEIPCLRSTNTI
jgi:hypothetical protein